MARLGKPPIARSRRGLWGFLLWFSLLLAAGQFAYHGLLRGHPALGDYLGALASVSAGILRAFGASVQAQGNVVVGRGFSFSIVTDCDAVEPILVYAAGVLAFPAGIGMRLAAAGLGALAIAVVNQLRIVSLYCVGARWPQAFDLVHEGLWQPALVLISFGLWYAYVRTQTPRRSP